MLAYYYKGAKGITSFLLCRLGVAKVRTHRAFNSAQWNVDVGRLSESEVDVLYRNVVSRIKRDEKYGGYDAVHYMMGQKTAELLGKSGFVNQRPSGESIVEGGVEGGMKRMEREWEDVDGYVSAEVAGRQGQRRKVTHI